MKIGNNLYFCPWCCIEIEQDVKKSSGAGKKGRGNDMVKCHKCGNLISQKTKIEIETKLERGQRV